MRAITERLGARYLARVDREAYFLHHKLIATLRDRAIHENPAEMDYLYMDHAYFSGLILAKAYLDRHPLCTGYEQLPEALLDAFCAIILHNSLFKFTIRPLMHTSEPLALSDGQPLAYLLMLCDELQCWNRASYGRGNRGGIYSFDFDLEFTPDGGMRWTYFYDSTFEEGLSLEYKLSNIAQAKGFDQRLYEIGCFYTDRPVEFEQLVTFSTAELMALAEDEHRRWCAEKEGLGWRFGDAHVGRLGGRNDSAMRERTRLHHDLIPFAGLSEDEVEKDRAPMEKMLELIREFDGLTIYRM